MPDECPLCGASLTYEDNGRKFTRVIGREVRGVYDGVLYWHCPDCKGNFHRFEEGTLHDKAEEYLCSIQ